ncbi:MAG: NAD-dependent epimerase/dehydratase family protein [Nitrososphaerota archaeon]|nr:NAD-dependent epimerase/dehydratase family protein [Nitrososphaerota archaeon]
MLRVGTTGQQGFIGTHLYNTLGLSPDKYVRIPFDRCYFEDQDQLKRFVSSCDVVVHLAGMNRHSDGHVLYETNVDLTRRLVAAMEAAGTRPNVLFSSSSQETLDNAYGRSKHQSYGLLSDWARKRGARFISLVIPNVFGPFGKPFYNSVVATFSHQLTHKGHPVIDVDIDMKLIYVGELVNAILEAIDLCGKTTADGGGVERVEVRYTSEGKVSEILERLTRYKETYLEHNIFPELRSKFEVNLFNTFRSYVDLQEYFPVRLGMNIDARGSFVETTKSEIGGQVSFSSTLPHVTRGNHFHTRKIERFAVINGRARIRLRKIGCNDVFDFELNGSEPSYVDMPIWYTHNITNIGEEELYTIFWINEFYDPVDPDTFFEAV